MQSISDFFTWLFSDRTGVICLVVTGIVVYQSISGPTPVTPAHPHVPMVGQPTIRRP